MYLFHSCASGVPAAASAAPIDPPISLQCLMLTLVCHPQTVHLLLLLLFPTSPFLGPSCSLQQSVYARYQDEKWMGRLVALCHQMSVMWSPSQHAKGFVVVTDKKGCCLSWLQLCCTHIEAERFLSLSGTSLGTLEIPQNDVFFGFRRWKLAFLPCLRDWFFFLRVGWLTSCSSGTTASCIRSAVK